jgi:hypothetical protein
MEKPSPRELEDAHAREDKDRGQNCRQFKGIRLRKWGSWVAEIRMPKSREKLWLGSYTSAQQAARAYDAAVYCLRGPAAKFNFPNSVPSIPSASSLSRRQIQLAASKYALDQLPSSSPSLQNINNKAVEEATSPPKPAPVSETELWSHSHKRSEERELDLWECLFEGSDSNHDGCLSLNLERMPSIEEVSALELIRSTCQQLEQEEEHMNIFLDPTELWNF